MSSSTVADVVVRGLARAGTPRIFAVPGDGAPLSLLDATRAAALPVVLAYGEAAACVMAAVTADLSAAPGVASVGSSAGVVAAASGVAHAVLDRASLVVLTDRHPREVLACRLSATVRVGDAAQAVARAVRAALTRPCGPVHLDMPAAVQAQRAEPSDVSGRPDPLPPPPPAALAQAAQRLAACARPLLVVGQHCRSSADAPWLRAFAEALPAPVLVTAKAKGVMPDPHPLVLDVVDVDAPDDPALHAADLIVAIGVDAAEAQPRAWFSGAPVLTLGPVPVDDHGSPSACEVPGEIGLVLEELAPRIASLPRADWDMTELDRLKRELPRRRERPSSGLPMHRAVQLAREAAEAGTLAAVDPGSHWSAVVGCWQAVAPGEFLTPNGATRGFAVSAAIAAALERPQRRVVGFTDSAGLLAGAAELETARRLGTRVVLVVFGGAETVRLGQGFGVPAYAADSEPAFLHALGRALKAPGPSLIGVFA